MALAGLHYVAVITDLNMVHPKRKMISLELATSHSFDISEIGPRMHTY